MKKNTIIDKIKYEFDNQMSKGASAMIVLLGTLSFLLVFFSGLIIWLFDVNPSDKDSLGLIEGIWQSLMRTIDAGALGGDNGWSFRILAFILTLGGIFILSTLIGILTTGIDNKFDQLRKGKSYVIEKDFVLILGWSSKIFTIISELVIANENQKKSRIVILSEEDKVEMEDMIRNKIKDLKNTKVICRSGNPNDLSDLENVNVNASKSIIILAKEDLNSDPSTIKTILAVTNNSNRRNKPYHIIAEIKDQKNLDIAKMVGKNEVELILTDEIIGRIMFQTARQSGLSIIYTDLLDFKGGEIYFKEEKTLINTTFGNILSAYNDSTVIGIAFADGLVQINPSMNYVLCEGDKIIYISDDDDSIDLSLVNNNSINESVIVNSITKSAQSERILMLGWNKRYSVIIRELDKY